MELLKLILIIIFITPSLPQEMFNTKALIKYPLSNDVKPVKYKILLKLDIEKNSYRGISNVMINIVTPTTMIALHSVYLNIIQSETVVFNTNTPERIKHVVTKILYLPEKKMVELYVNPKLTLGFYILNMEFTGSISDNMGGFLKIPYTNQDEEKKWFFATPTWVTGIRRTFPCWDEPDIKTIYDITVEHQSNYMVFSNTLQYTTKSFKCLSNSIEQIHFFDTPVISTYLLSIVLCNLSTINTHLKGRSLLERDLTFASYIIEKSTSYFETQWKHWSQLPIEDHFAIPGFADDGIAKSRLVFYREQDIIYDEELDHIGRKMEVSLLIGRKIALQRLTNTNPSSPYFWLNEGIAVLYAFDSINKIYPELRIWDLFVVQILQESLRLDNEGIMNPLIFEYDYTSDINSQFFLSSYIKAPAILRMLQHILRDNVFRKGIDKYIKSQSATLNDFLDAMQTVHNEEQSMLPYNITEIIYPWLSQSHYPVLSVTEQYDKEPPYVKIKIENGSGTWWIPFTTNVTSSSLDFNTLDISVELWKDKDEKSVMPTQRLASDYWIILNLQQIGYYRVTYGTIYANIWQNIARYINSYNYTNIHVLNRAQIIDDAAYFTITGHLNSSIFWTLTSYLMQDTDYIAWYPMIKAIERTSYIIPFPDNGDFFKDILFTRLEPVGEIIGYEEDPQENYFTKCLRQEAIKWICDFSDSESQCNQMALNKLEWHLSSPIEISTVAALIDIINHVYTKESLDKIRGFVKNRLINATAVFDSEDFVKKFVLVYKEQFHDLDKLLPDIPSKIDIRLTEIKNQIDTFVHHFR
ncbi:PREDICTED: glutamyl aminopeptidase-like isoform X3 [Vollenhovia emeryi]|uniref:glutamyl aminopeptidase-like isoform X3 n=1 Tax=Vollenhovia emeryi TaxID=411798 RepID=UPI0005F3F76E|nr:PREDICTED: glutamyl aminopeptidase-like isoform X3 [Vollenhovia emeryi]